MSEVVLPFGAGKRPWCLKCKTPIALHSQWVLFADASHSDSTKLFCAACYIRELDHQLRHDPRLVVAVVDWVSDDDDDAG